MLRPWSPLALIATLVCGKGGPPKPSASRDRIDALERRTHALPDSAAGISYLRAGDPGGQRVIFVHGTPGEARGWADFLLHVRPGFEYIAIDRPGFGESGPAGAVVSLAAQAQALAPLLVARDGRWPILVGHSLGGPVVVHAALDRRRMWPAWSSWPDRWIRRWNGSTGPSRSARAVPSAGCCRAVSVTPTTS